MGSLESKKVEFRIKPMESVPEIDNIVKNLKGIEDKNIHMSVLFRGRAGGKTNDQEEENSSVDPDVISVRREVKRTAISDRSLRQLLLKNVLNTLEKRSFDEPIPYNSTYIMHSQECMKLPKSEIPSLQSILDLIRVDNELFDPHKYEKLALLGFIFQYSKDTYGFLISRSGNSVWSERQLSKKLIVTMTDGQVNRIDNIPTFFIPQEVDALLVGEYVYVFEKAYFEKFFDFRMEISRRIRDGKDAMAIYINSPEDLIIKCKNLENTRKLYSCLKNMQSGKIKMENVRKITLEKGLRVSFTKDGRIDLNNSIPKDVLRVLDDDWVIGRTTESEYYSTNKKQA